MIHPNVFAFYFILLMYYYLVAAPLVAEVTKAGMAVLWCRHHYVRGKAPVTSGLRPGYDLPAPKNVAIVGKS